MTIAEQAHQKIAQEREQLMTKAEAEIEAEWQRRFAADAIQTKKDRQFHDDHMAAVRRAEADKVKKVDDTLDRIIGPIKRGRGRPKGTKNKPKQGFVIPSAIGHIPDDDLILPRGK
jgi:hypothetical protein